MIDGASDGYKKTTTDFYKYERKLSNNGNDWGYKRENENKRMQLKILEFKVKSKV